VQGAPATSNRKIATESGMRIKNKLALLFSAAFAVVLLGMWLSTFSQTRALMDADVERESGQLTGMMQSTVDMTLSEAVENYLRAVAEKNLDIVRDFYRRAKDGEMSEAQARAEATRILLAQHIGETGYIYCLDSKGVLEVHPVASLLGSAFKEYGFVREQIARREGYLEYDWRNPGEVAAREKALYMTYFAPWDWIISASSYREEFARLLDKGAIAGMIRKLAAKRTGYLFILDSRGGMVVPPPETVQRVPLLDRPELLRDLARAQDGFWTPPGATPEDVESTDHRVFRLAIPRFKWIVAHVVFLEPFRESVHRIRFFFVLALGLSLVLVMLLSVGISASIARPLEALAGLSVRSRTEYGGEAGTLARCFNTFMDQLSEQYGTLERQVVERTRELQAEVAERKAAEARAQEQYIFLSALIESMPNPVYYSDNAGVLLGGNGAFLRNIARRAASDAVGLRLDALDLPAELLRVAECTLDSKDSADPEGSGDAPASANAAARSSDEVVLVTVADAAGAQRHYLVSGGTFQDHKGRVAGCIGILLDVTARMAAQRELNLLSRAIEQAAEATIITDARGRIEYVNPYFERLTGYTRAEVAGRSPDLLRSGQHGEEFYERMWAVLNRGEVWSGRLVNRCKDGSLIQVDATIVPIKDERGRVVNFVGMEADMTERLALEGQLLQSQKLEAIGQLAAGIAHEINTPLQFVANNLTFIRESCDGALDVVRECLRLRAAAGDVVADAGTVPALPGALDGLLEEMDADYVLKETGPAFSDTEDGLKRMAEIVSAMRDFSHPGQKERIPTDVNQALRNTLTVSRNAWKHVAEVDTELDESLPRVPCLVGELNQALLNIIINASQAIAGANGADGEPGRITVRTRAEGEWVRIEIQDSGPGISPEIRDRIFDPFFTTKEVGVGTGQGLAITRSIIVDKHGGEISVRSEPGQGATFVVRLPVNVEE
jgi:PAS domain S-box-containing protein